MNIALTDLITNLPKSNNINNFTTYASNAKLESFDQKLQDIFSNIEENLGFKNSPMPEKEVLKNNKKNNGSNELLIKTIEKSNNNLLVTLNVNDSKDLIISNTKKNKNIKLDVDQLLLLIETSIKNAKNIDKKELLIQAQKILSSSKTEFTEDDIEVLQKAFNIIIKERASNTEIHLEGLIKHSKFIDETPSTLSQNNIHSNGSQETNQIVSPDIQKLLQLIEKTSKSIENKNEINTLEQAQKILISSKTELTEEDKEVLQKAFSIIMKESKASNSEIPLVGLIKHSKSIEETPSTLSQNNLQSKGSQEAGQIVNSDIQKLLSTIQESSKNIENKDEINTLEQAQKILSSFKTEFTPDELNIIKTALGINTNNNSKMGNSSSNLIEEATLITNSLIKGNTDKTKNNKIENNNFIKSMEFDQKSDLLNTKNNFGKNVYFDPYETRKNNINKDKNSELQKDNTVKLIPTSNLGDVSKNLNIEQLKTNQSTNEIDLKSLQINKNSIQDGIPETNLKDLNVQIKEVIISKNTQTFLNESFSVKISPPDLGKVDIQILKNGQAVTVNISTETENAKNIISKTLQSLIGNLRDEGYQPINIKVNVTQEEHYLADQNKQHQQEQEQKKYDEDNQNDDQPKEGTYYTFDDYLRSDVSV
ncbi:MULTISPECIES: flagellar hook-length control protein FliK [Petrotoga]|uniref:Flagellar hook-length control protein FliK n=2 Tax=Petrotoga sibirica TaxID=156202 RepID=A0A4R8EUK3_9BACT|nr:MULTISPECIES: flagellar hook-length control protein FliK [Petrotoga]POZ89455.1 hypothetical protein AA80_00450 [Petrotoga sibirica DSM 13575]POZ91897.1 hypothetical protein AD60_00450 [Petrotoga sp. SL27]TDX16262.1 flagellar hook-length control protein FliK [Petrotoga sibirica]